jgi:hypothetical protein
MKTNESANVVQDPDIAFLLSECSRLFERLEKQGLADFIKTAPREDSGGSLKLSGGGSIFCGVKALQRLYDRAKRALRASKLSGSIQPEPFYGAFKRIVVERFFEQHVAASVTEVESVIREALEEIEPSCVDLLHYIPCRLMRVEEPNSIAVGPVTFYRRETFDEKAVLLYDEYLRRAESEGLRNQCDTLAQAAKRYYEGFTWVAKVKVFACDPATSRDRADVAASAALDVLHLVLGPEYTRRMYVGGPRLPDDPRARLVVDNEGHLDVSCSRSATSEVGFGPSLRPFFERVDVERLIAAAGKTIQPLVDPRVQQPLGLRMAGALSWFGDAAREQSDAARIVKATNALERLLVTWERKKEVGVTKAFSRRGAAISYGGPAVEDFEALGKRFSAAYELRSRLAHGSASPFDPEVTEQAPVIMNLARHALCCAFGFFEQRGLFDRLESDAELPQWLDDLAVETEAHEKAIFIPPPALTI